MKIIVASFFLTLLINCNTVKENQEKKSISIENTTWVWQYTLQNKEKLFPIKKDVFEITFDNGNLRIGTDCNTMGGNYTINNNSFELGRLMSTKMYCKGSQESTFGGMLSNSKTIEWDEKELQLKSENGDIMYFQKK